MGCHFLLQCIKVKRESEVPQLCLTLSDPIGLQPTRLLHPWDFPGKSTGVGCHCLLRSRRLLKILHFRALGLQRYDVLQMYCRRWCTLVKSKIICLQKVKITSKNFAVVVSLNLTFQLEYSFGLASLTKLSGFKSKFLSPSNFVWSLDVGWS